MRKSLLVLLMPLFIVGCDKNDNPVVTSDNLTAEEQERVQEIIEDFYSYWGEVNDYVIEATDRFPKLVNESSTVQFARKTLRDEDINLITNYIKEFKKRNDVEYMLITQSYIRDEVSYALIIGYTGGSSALMRVYTKDNYPFSE